MDIYCLKASHVKTAVYMEDITNLSIVKLTKFMDGYAWKFVCDVGSYNGKKMQWRTLHLNKYKGELKYLVGTLYKFEPELLEH